MADGIPSCRRRWTTQLRDLEDRDRAVHRRARRGSRGIAYQRFGRGSGHPARLNMGDCFSYALARDLGEPLLFKGSDFALTDIELSWSRSGAGA